MITRRDIEIRLEIISPMDDLADADSNILNILRHKYNGRCIHRCYIKNVIGIKLRSEALLLNRGDECPCVMNIVFEAEVIVYNPGDVIHGCTITHKNERTNMIVAESDNAKIYLNMDERLASIAEKQIISIRVGRVGYGPGNMHIAINAYPFIPDRFFPNRPIYAYRPYDSSLDDGEISIIETIIADITRAEDLVAANRKTDGERLSFFESILYPRKTAPSAKSKHKGLKEILVSAVKSAKIDDIYYMRDPEIAVLDDAVYTSDEPDKYTEMTDLGAYAVLVALSMHYLERLNNLNELFSVYNTQDMIQSHKNIWKIIMSQRL